MGSYLITGGSGFLGSIMKKKLLERGDMCLNIDLEHDELKHENLVSIKGDIRDYTLMNEVFSKYKFDAIFHFAALLAHEKKSLKDLWSCNVDGTMSVLRFAKDYNINKIIFTSSNCLWGQNFDYPVTENEIPNPIEIYGKSKLECEKMLLSESNTINSVIFRCPTIMDEGRLGLLAILYEFMDEDRKIWMVGDGMNRYQFIYAKDLTNACLLALDYNHSNIFNIGSDNVKTFNEVYSYVIKNSNSKSKLAHLPKNIATLGMKLCFTLGLSPLGPYQYKMISSSFIFDINKIKNELGFNPTLTNEEMMLKAFKYYHTNREEIKLRKNVSAHNRNAKMGIIRFLKWIS